MRVQDIIIAEATADPDVVEKFARVSDKDRSYYIMKWAEEKGIDNDDAMEMAGYKKGSYRGYGSYDWHYNPPRESVANEAPAGMLGQIGRKLGAKALGAIGAKGKAAELTGKAEVGDEANQLKTALRGYAGKAGINIKQLQGPQLAAFLKSKGYPNMHLKDVQGIMTPKQIDQAVMQAAQDAAKADGDPGKGVSTAPAQPSAPGTATPGQVQKGQVVMFDTPDGGVVQGSVISTDGKTAKVKGPTKTYNVSNDQLKDFKTGKPLVNQGTNVAASGGQGAPGQGTSVAGKPTSPQVDKNKDGKDDNTGKVISMPTSIPPEVQKQLDALSPTEKKVLAGAL